MNKKQYPENIEERIHVLVVEDEDAHAELIRRAFESQAGRVSLTFARNLREARAIPAESPPDLAIIDLVLPDGRGIELLPGDKEKSPYPVVIMTSHGDEAVAVAAIKTGALDYVVKSEEALNNMPRTAERALREWGHITERKRAEEALTKSEERYRTLVDQASDGIFVANAQGNYVDVNTSGCQMVGYTKIEILKLNIKDLVPAGDLAANPIPFDELRSGKTIIRESRLKCKDGSILPVEISAKILSDERLQGIVRDISDRMQAEAHIQHLQSVLKAIRHVNQLIVHEKNRKKLMQGACEILNQNRNYKLVWIGLVQEGTKEVLPSAQAGFEDDYLKSIKITWDDSETGHGPTGTAVRTRKPFVMQDIAGDHRYKPWRKEAMKRGYASSLAAPLVYENRVFGAVNVYASLMDAFDEEEIGLLVEVGQDIAFALHTIEVEEERERAEKKLQHYQQQLRSLASELSLAEERERRRIAEDLHDRIAQTLAMAKIKLAELQEMATSTEFSQPLDIIQTMIEQTVNDARSLIFEISSPILHELGFEAAVEWLTEHFSEQHDLLFNFEDDKKDKPLDDHIRIFLFKALQELLINIVKHAMAATARICVRRKGETIEVLVEDDGRGFNVSKAEYQAGRTGGFGLFNICERLDYHGGTCEIKSEPGRGTQIILEAPLKRRPFKSSN